MYPFGTMGATSIKGMENMSPQEVAFEVARGGSFVVYTYCVSLLVITFRRQSPIYFVRGGESKSAKALPYTLISLVFGWWGIPWGFIYTPQSIYKNLNGGTDVSAFMIQQLNLAPASPPSLSIS